MKILALDAGEQWIGTALSDALAMFAKPYKTVKPETLEQFLTTLFEQENIQTIVIGYPKTMRGTQSEQTRSIIHLKESLEQRYPDKQWILWDERLSSKRAEQLKKSITKEQKIQSHSIAAAFILESYLNFLEYQKM